MSRVYAALCLTLLLALYAGAAEVVRLHEDADPVSIRVAESGLDRTVIELDLGSFVRGGVGIDGRVHDTLTLDGESNLLAKGLPDLPNVARSVIIPDDAEMTVRVLSSHYVELEGVDVAPSKGEIERNVDPSTVPYEFDAFYGTDAWYPSRLAETRSPYIMRDVRGMVVVINPFRYNPASRTLRVYDRVTVAVERVGPGQVNVLDRRPPGGLTPEFAAIYESHFLNAEAFSAARYTPVGEVGNMLVICYADFMDEMQPFVDWKNQMGIPCEMVSAATAGGSASAIRDYIQDYYDSIGLTFVLLVGDAAEIPSLSANGGPSDPSFSLVAGSDSYPDIIVGRLSAEAGDQVDTQVLRSIEYEKSPQNGADWYHKGTGIASTQGPGDDGEYDHEHSENLRTDLLSFTYTEVDQLYGTGVVSDTDVAEVLNDGRGIINYTGHGQCIGWSTSGFTNADVHALVNDNMLPFIWSVACENGNFAYPYGPCFAEVWLTATNGTEPTGAVAALMSSINQDWDEPMDAQDEMVDLLVAGAKRTFGGLAMNGCSHMLDEYGPSGEDDFKAWHIFGDPSLRVRTDAPGSLAVSHAPSVDPSDMTFTVVVDGVEGALCALYREGVSYGAAFTDGGGTAVIDIETVLPALQEVTVTVTSFNAIPYFGSVAVGEAYTALIDVAPLFVGASLGPEATSSETLTIGNAGEPQSILQYVVDITDAGMARQLDESGMAAEPDVCEPGETLDLVFTLSNDSADGEWFKGASLAFPAGVIVNSCTDFVVSDRELVWDGAAGDTALVTWTGNWWNVVYPGEEAVATVNITVDAGFSGNVRIIYGLAGDGYGDPPHSLSGTLVIDCAVEPLITLLTPNGNEAWGIGEPHDITWEPTGVPSLLLDISYSLDGGRTWDSIVAGTEDDGEYTWVVDAAVSDDCLVRVALSAAPDTDDVSDASFSIFQPVDWLSVSPASGNVYAGETDSIEVTFDTTGMPDGEYFADIVVTSNGGDPVVVPVTLHVGSSGVDDRVPQKPVVYGNFPNPFWPSTGIAFSVPSTTRVRLSVYTVSGRLVGEVEDRLFGAGRHVIPWDGTDADGDVLPEGVYLYRLEAGSEDLTGKMLLLR